MKPSLIALLIGAALTASPCLAQEFIDPYKLESNSTYRLERQTPLVATPNPADPMQAMADMKLIPAGHSITIVGKSEVKSKTWYQVEVRRGEQVIANGWVNPVALVGQKLQRR